MSSESSGAMGLSSNFRTADFRSRKISDDRRRKFFRLVSKHAYPRQTVHEIRRLTREKYGERTIYDWIAGRSDAPLSVYIKLMDQILEG